MSARSCDGCGRIPQPGERWRARRRESDGLGFCPNCRPLHPVSKVEHRCSSCAQIKPIVEFYTKRGYPSGPCKACILDRHRLERYGVTPEDLEAMLEDQDGVCAICFGEMLVPYVDHCHDSGIVRGALCRDCNSGLGMFKDRADVMARAIEYLGGGHG